MVAVPLAGQALLARSPGFGGTMPGMTTKIALRGRNQESYRRWIANRDDCITAHGLDGLMANAMMPTLDTVKERYPELSLAKQQETLSRALQQYQDENTALYFLVKESVIISGAYEALDREYITNKFVGQNGARNLRDGLGFLRWVDSFFDVTKDDAQINIKKDFTTKMKVSSGDASRDNMEKSWLDGLQVWKTINGNNEYDRVSLETYYTAIRDGLLASEVTHPSHPLGPATYYSCMLHAHGILLHGIRRTTAAAVGTYAGPRVEEMKSLHTYSARRTPVA